MYDGKRARVTVCVCVFVRKTGRGGVIFPLHVAAAHHQ